MTLSRIAKTSNGNENGNKHTKREEHDYRVIFFD